MCNHGDVRNVQEKQYYVINKEINKKAKVVQLSTIEKYVVKEVFCAKCNNWQEADSRYFITDIFCPTCCVNW